MIWTGLATMMMAANVQATPAAYPTSGQGVLIRTEAETVLVTLDLDRAPLPGCAFLRGLLDGKGSRMEPLGQGVQAVRGPDGKLLGVFVEMEADTSQTAQMRVGHLLASSEAESARGVADHAAVSLTGDISLMGPNPDQCGW